jgi:hypothetical protein
VLPNLDAANILFNVLKITGGHGVTIGPILLGAARAGAHPHAVGHGAPHGQHDGAGGGRRGGQRRPPRAPNPRGNPGTRRRGGAPIIAPLPLLPKEPLPMPRATKIVATLGPASSDPEVLERLIRAGVDVVRLNFSHGKAQDHIARANLVRASRTRWASRWR